MPHFEGFLEHWTQAAMMQLPHRRSNSAQCLLIFHTLRIFTLRIKVHLPQKRPQIQGWLKEPIFILIRYPVRFSMIWTEKKPPITKTQTMESQTLKLYTFFIWCFFDKKKKVEKFNLSQHLGENNAKWLHGRSKQHQTVTSGVTSEKWKLRTTPTNDYYHWINIHIYILRPPCPTLWVGKLKSTNTLFLYVRFVKFLYFGF